MEDNGNKESDSYDLVVGIMGGVHQHLHNVPLHTITVGDLKVRVLTHVAELRGFGKNINRIADPELMTLVVFHSDGFPSSYVSHDDSQSLRDYLSDAGYFTSPLWKFAKTSPIQLRLAQECTWYQYAHDFAKAKKMKEEEQDDKYYDDDYYGYADEEGDYSDEEQYDKCYDDDYYGSADGDGDYSDEEPDLDDILIKRRPRDMQGNDKDVLRVVGRLHVEARLDDDTIKRRRVGYMGGFPYDLKDVVNMITTAKYVVLATTAFNHDMLNNYHSRLNHDIDNDPDDNILALLVTWDKFSYLFLRKLRKSIGPNVPIIAITDSDLHHLDLLAFLDTPPPLVDSLYGWDLCKDCADLDLMDVVVDVKWAGLRPSETLAPSRNTRARSVGTPDYANLCNLLKSHPRFLGDSKWLEELALFEEHPLYLRLQHFGMSKSELIFPKYFFENYLPDKFTKEDWI